MLPDRHKQRRSNLFLRGKREATETKRQSGRRRSGWRRYAKRILLRLSQLGGTPYSIAAGVACGVAVSFTPFVGFHFVLAAATAWLVRGNVLAGALGTAAGNPWTFPFIWVSVLYTGRFLLGEYGRSQIEFTKVFEKAMHALITFDFSSFGRDVWPVVWPMMVGCVPFYIAAWAITYYVVKKSLEKIGRFRKYKNERADKIS